MHKARWITGAVLLVVVGLLALAIVSTGPAAPPAGGERATGVAGGGPRRERLVDTRPVLTARRVAVLATTPEEAELARQAERLADHSVDLAFVEAMVDATESPPEPTPEIRELLAARTRAQEAVDAGHVRIQALEEQIAAAPRSDRQRLQDQMEVAKARLELDQDELEAASESLRRVGGDPQLRVRRLKEVYEAAQRDARPTAPAAATTPTARSSSVLARLRDWTWQRDKLAQLEGARRETLDKQQRMARRRTALAERMRQETEARESAKRAAETLSEGGGAASTADAGEALAALKRFANSERKLASLDRRLADGVELAEVYGSWTGIASASERAALHRVLHGLLWVVVTLLAAFLGCRIVEHLFGGLASDKLRMATLRTVGKFVVQVAAAVVVLFLVFGVPDQTTTILGLAGAGLTVALKDFIVAFFGWFMLMGPNGIRVGDWVEIKGVGGQVAEIGLLHTVLLETGSWSEAGHPTGRRVSFVNSFAMEGHYFNFSTSGQWMWDDLRVLIPLGQDPYPILAGVQLLVERESEANAKAAEAEWRALAARYRVQAFSVVPGINVVPTANGMELRVRYLTRANERNAARKRLYQAVVELMHGKPAERAGAA
jgi:small-conductance mechanosensitive channel